MEGSKENDRSEMAERRNEASKHDWKRREEKTGSWEKWKQLIEGGGMKRKIPNDKC